MSRFCFSLPFRLEALIVLLKKVCLMCVFKRTNDLRDCVMHKFPGMLMLNLIFVIVGDPETYIVEIFVLVAEPC